MKTLPINTSPYIRAYPNHAFIHTVINNEMTCNHTLAKIHIENATDYEWNKKSIHSKIELQGDLLEVSSHPYEKKNGCCVFRNCIGNDELVIKVNYQQFVNVWSSINLFLMPKTNNLDSFMELINSQNMNEGHLFGKLCGKGYYYVKEKQLKLYWKALGNTFKPYWMKLRREKDMISFYISEDNHSWELLEEDTIGIEESTEFNIGISINLCDNQYYNWAFTNFIQLYVNLDWPTCIDWAAYPKKSWKNYTCNPLLTFHPEPPSLLETRNWDMWDFICDSINNHRYIEFILQEQYIKGTYANLHNFSFFHENLCYGYDMDTKTVLFMHFYRGKPKLLRVPYQEFLFAFELYKERDLIYTLEYLPDEDIYSLNLKHICKSLNDYVTSGNTSEEYSKLCNPTMAVYGISIYDELITDKGISMIMSDRRIPYIIFEHKKVMKDRLEYLLVRNIITENEIAMIARQVNEVYERSDKILMLVLKNQMKSIDHLPEIIRNHLMQIKLIEQECYTDFMNLLLSKI